MTIARGWMCIATCVWLWVTGPMAAQPGKKVYISVDMEGITGVVGDDQVSAGGAEYGRTRTLMAGDTNAAIEGARLAGATDILVNDSHGGQRNLRLEDLAPGVRLISHTFKRHGMMEGLDESFDAVLFVGYHAKAGASRGVFAHTGSGVVRDLTINGRSVGESGMNAALAAWYGVPVVMVSGDDAAVEEVTAVVPGVKGAVVKRAINSRAAELQAVDEARARIRQAARDGVSGATRPAPAREASYRVQLRYANVAYPEIATAFQEVELVAPDTVAFTRRSMPEAYRLIRVLYRFINPD